jgi:methylenetetrahydrofolate reductase (NADPH)
MASIKHKLNSREPLFSFEFFPPKTEKGEAAMRESLRELVPLKPSFVSVTYGAGGSTREKTRRIVKSIQDEHCLDVVAHITCYGHTYDDIRRLLAEYREAGISNFLALRGDPPREEANWRLTDNGPQHAIELVKMCKEMGDVSVGVAAFPDKHPEAPDLQTDLKFLKEKVEAGADFVITQLFFDNDRYFHLVHHAREEGVSVPIIPGIMPITKVGQIEKFLELSACSIPKKLVAHLEEHGHDEQRVQEIGLAYCASQCVDLLRRGAPGIHFYTLNQSRACHTVYAALHAMGMWRR